MIIQEIKTKEIVKIFSFEWNRNMMEIESMKNISYSNLDRYY